MQHIHKAWSAFATAIASRQLANYFLGREARVWEDFSC
jgi:hypothetical protein